MRAWALVSSEARETVDVYLRREDAEADLRAAVEDVPEWAAILRVEPFEVGEASPN